MIKRCKTCSSTIDSGISCDACTPPPSYIKAAYKPNTSNSNMDKVVEALTKDLERICTKTRDMTLPIDSQERKNYPLLSGCLNYFPAALAGVANISKKGNDKHNPGQELHHARGKSMDHPDCIVRHLMDVQDLLAQDNRSALTPKGIGQLLEEVSSLAWRALAYSQELHEQFGAPLAPGAKK